MMRGARQLGIGVVLALGVSACGDDVSVGTGGGGAGAETSGTVATSSTDASSTSSTAPGSSSSSGDGGAGGSGGAGGGGGAEAAVPCSACFPIEELPEELQDVALDLLLQALDTEALYSIAGDLKPMSSGFASLELPTEDGGSAELDDLVRIMGAFRCGSALEGGVQVFAQDFQGTSFAEALVFRVPRFVDTVEAYPDPFETLGVDPATPRIEVVHAVDVAPDIARFRGYGYLFGYPDHAVDFFVEAAETEAETGEFVERDFVHIPVYDRPTGAFTYAVPVGHELVAADLELAEAAQPVLATYAALRDEYVGDGKAGVLALLRSWFDDGTGLCSPEHAAFDVPGPWQPEAPPTSCWSGAATCDPLGETCDLDAGEACDFADGELSCFPAPNVRELGETCGNDVGFCQHGLHCLGGTCLALCCDDAACTVAGEVCDPFDASMGTLGTCREEGACNPAGAFCVANDDCCSGDCHLDHCH